ncbi:MAG: DUF1080 domain-containing protein [Verrucomicrobiales bacterium]|nr:DUF1080 domain-containing protein [Verrucomicrobiales bacterium]
MKFTHFSKFLAAFGVLGFFIFVSAQGQNKPGENEPAPEKPEISQGDWASLFDGKTLEGWDGDPALWRVEEGCITGETTADKPLEYNSFLQWADGQLDDFELKLDFRIQGGNSGVQVRSFALGKPHSIGGYQADIDFSNAWSGSWYGEQYRGILAKRGQKTTIGEDGKPTETGGTGSPETLAQNIKAGDWNEMLITARGTKLSLSVNGILMSEIVDEDTDSRRRQGLLALQLHKGPPMKVQFRTIVVKRLPLGGNVKKIVFIAGPPSHPPRQHEHNAGTELAARLLNENHPDKVLATVYHNRWPSDPSAFQNADAVIIHGDGGSRQPAYWHRQQVQTLADRGVGIGCIHYAVEMLPGESNDSLISWIGGAFEINQSVNPHWEATFTSLPDHPVTRGVQPFKINDEWYFNMRFEPGMKGVTPILSAIPGPETMTRPDGEHSGNPGVRKMVADQVPQHLCWVKERDNGGRGFGFTGCHFHDNWANDSFRKTLLNAICWVAKVDIPSGGIDSPTLTHSDLDANLDPKPAPKPKVPAKALNP